MPSVVGIFVRLASYVGVWQATQNNVKRIPIILIGDLPFQRICNPLALNLGFAIPFALPALFMSHSFADKDNANLLISKSSFKKYFETLLITKTKSFIPPPKVKTPATSP